MNAFTPFLRRASQSLAVMALGAGSLLAQALPSDNDLKREERDAKYMMQLQVQNAEGQAKTQAKLREEQERAASAMRQLYEDILEKQRRDAGSLTDDERNVLTLRAQMQGGAAGGLRMPRQSTTEGARPAQVAEETMPKGKGGPEMARAIDALAMEDGPEIARKKGLGFIPMGTIADVRLLTAVNTAIPGVVIGQLVYDLWDVDTRLIVVPRGSKLIGQAASMGSDTEARGKVVFHTFVEPNGRIIPIATPVIAANRIGISGIDGAVDYHWARMLGSSVALAVISGLTGQGSNSPYNSGATNSDLIRQNTVSGLGQSSNQLLQRFSKIQPDITLEEGSTAKIILVTNIMAKPYRVVWPTPQNPR